MSAGDGVYGVRFMEGKAKLLGHSLHPMLIVFPLGLLGGSVVFEVVYYITGSSMYSIVTYWMIISGIIGGLLAAVFGLLDWTAIPAGSRAKSVGLMHAAANVVVLLLFAASWYLRSGPSYEPSVIATVLAGLGLLVALVGGWLGGELVERLGVAVHEGANVNAPSSLVTEDVNAPQTRLRNV